MNPRTSLWCATRGPVILIVLGSLFALDQNGGPGFGRTWPLLIVVIGLWKLMERLSAGAGERQGGI